MKIVADAHIPYVQDYFGEDAELVLKPGRLLSANDVQAADMLLVRSVTPVDRDLLTNSRVKFVGSVTAGQDHLDTAWLDQAGIAWYVASGFNAPPVADYILSVIAALQRKQVIAETGLRAAVIGVGHVGKLVTARLACLGVQLTCCDPIRAANEADFRSTALDTIEDQDLILLHVPLTREGPFPTYHLIDDAFLRRQRPEAVLINASRGAVIDTDALLVSGKHLYWCFDVWEHEPKIHKAVLERAFIATPHMAGYSVQSRIRGTRMIYELACRSGLLPLRPVAPVVMPRQTVSFAGDHHHWQDVALGAFNPILTTAMMRTQLLPEGEVGYRFDEMRMQCHYRHELAYLDVDLTQLVEADRELLTALSRIR